MAEIKLNEMLQDMVDAGKGALSNHWEDAKDLATSEFKKYQETLTNILQMKVKGKITLDEAKVLIDMQKNSMRISLLTLKGLGAIAVEDAINAVIGVIRGTVNKAVGWQLL